MNEQINRRNLMIGVGAASLAPSLSDVVPVRPITPEDIDLYQAAAALQARETFWAYRQYINGPDMALGWWQEEVAYHLQEFYEDLIAGKRPVLLLSSPPQHGKTTQVTDFISWISGKAPGKRTMFTSYSDDLGVGVNLALQRIYDGDKYKKCFDLRISGDNVVTQAGRYLRNSSILEYIGQKGSFRNTTVNGQINGLGLDLGVIDDPIKGRKEAQSKTQRDAAWGWLTDDFFGRFSKDAGFIMIMTRWHIDDPAARFIERFPNTKVLAYKAIATKDETYRRAGEALFPEHKPIEFLNIRKQLMTAAGWESVYQQEPIVSGGETFPIEMIDIIPQINRKDVRRSVRYWDKAGTEDGGAYTSGCLMHLMKDGTFCVESIVRGQWKALDREKHIKNTAASDASFCPNLDIWVEQEPGSGGKESVEATIRMLAGYRAHADRVSGKGTKEIRAEPYAAQVQGGNVSIKAADWNRDFLDEHETWPGSKYKDQVDSSAGAFNKLANAGEYDTSLSWV